MQSVEGSKIKQNVAFTPLSAVTIVKEVPQMEKGISKYWTPELEDSYKKRLATCQTFAQRHLIMTIRDLLKYDGRTKESKRAVAQGRLRIVTATDTDIEELAKLEAQMKGGGGPASVPDRIEAYKRLKARIRERGIKGRELECQ